MRIIIVVAVAIVTMIPVSIAWYTLLPIAYSIGSQIESIASGQALTTLYIAEYVALLWGPLWDIFIILWAVVESQRVDYQGITYGG